MDFKTASAHSGVEALSKLHVDGNLIKNESGATVILRGINIADPYALKLEGHLTESDFRFVVENWHPNILRVPIHPGWWSPNYIDDYLVPLVNWAQKYRVYILLDYHDFGNPSGRMDLIKSTWSNITSRFKGNPAVLYDIFNEPHSVSWGQWKTMAEDIIATIRSIDPESVVMVGGVDWGYSLIGAGSNPIGYANIVYSTHPYPVKPTPWETYFGSLTATYPVFAGEWGFADDGSGDVWDTDRSYAINLLYYLETKGMGWAAWILHTRYMPNLLLNWGYTPTESGYLFKDWLFESHLDNYVVNGLRSQYFDNKNFTGLALERRDLSVDFDWGAGSPDAAMGADTFGIRWVGKVKVDLPDMYTFYTYTDDGVRLWVDGQIIIDRWTDQTATEWSSPIVLDIGLHSILLEYYENIGDAVARLSWSSPLVAKQVIPSSNLYHLIHPSPDTTPPEIRNLDASPPIQQFNLSINVSADVTDDLSVYEVLLNITSPGGGTLNSTMVRGMGTNFHLNQTFNELGNHSFVLWASDSSGNWNSTAGYFNIVSLPARPPTILYAQLAGAGHEDVQINWDLSPDDGMGSKSVVGYRIYRNMTYDPQGLGYAPIALLPNGTSQFVDNLAGEGNPNNHFYVVCAVNATDTPTCSQDQAGKFTRSLAEGPNLVSFPLIQSDEDTATVLRTVAFDKTWSYDSSSQGWKSYMTSKPYRGDFIDVNHTVGFWINVTASSNLTVAGLVPSASAVSLRPGWNLVGFPSFNSTYTIADLKAETGAQRVEGFSPIDPPYFLRLMSDGDVLQTGFGYWVNVDSAATWTISAS
jgi:hypothetical protein